MIVRVGASTAVLSACSSSLNSAPPPSAVTPMTSAVSSPQSSTAPVVDTCGVVAADAVAAVVGAQSGGTVRAVATLNVETCNYHFTPSFPMRCGPTFPNSDLNITLYAKGGPNDGAESEEERQLLAAWPSSQSVLQYWQQKLSAGGSTVRVFDESRFDLPGISYFTVNDHALASVGGLIASEDSFCDANTQLVSALIDLVRAQSDLI